MKNLLILGYYGYGNCGDDAILLSIKGALNNIDNNIKVTVLSNKPSETEKLYGIKAIYRFNPFSLLYVVLKCDILLCGGGTLLQDRTSTRSIIYYLSIIGFARMLGKKVILYSNGTGPISKKINLKLTNKIVNQVNVITFREEDSKEYLEKLGVKKPKMLVTADPAFGLGNIKKEDYRCVFDRNNIPMDKEIFGVSVRAWKNKENYFADKIVQICDHVIKNKNMNVVFLNMQSEHDKKVSEKIMKKMNDKAYMITEKLTPLEILGVTANFKTMISMRLHGIIFAAKQRVPVAGIIYDPKVDYYLNALSMPDIGSTNEIDVSKAEKIIDDLIDNNESYRLMLDKIVTELEEKERMNGEELKKLIKNVGA